MAERKENLEKTRFLRLAEKEIVVSPLQVYTKNIKSCGGIANPAACALQTQIDSSRHSTTAFKLIQRFAETACADHILSSLGAF